MRHFDWANLGYFELWFAVMGVLLIACARARQGTRTVTRPTARARLVAVRVGTALSLAGIATAHLGRVHVRALDLRRIRPRRAGHRPAILTVTTRQRRSR